MKKILLIEDDTFLIDIYTTKLKEVGFDIDFAANDKEALTKIKENVPDLIILDIVLPQCDGWVLIRKIKSDEKLKTIPIIILSNLGRKEEVEKGIELGAVKYLIKAHYTPSEVAEEVKKVLK